MSSINSIVHWFPELERHTCGYCKQENGAVSYGMWAEKLNVEDYQNLIDRGWRRSGMYCYKPIMDLTCCPQYTIRCDTSQFKLSKSQKKIIKKFNKYVTDGSGYKQTCRDEEMDNVLYEDMIMKEKPSVSLDYNLLSEATFDQNIAACGSTFTEIPKTDIPKQIEKHSLGPDLNKPPSKKAKFLRLERKKQKLLTKGIVFEPTVAKNSVKSLEDLLSEVPENSKFKFKTKLIPSVDMNNKLESDKIAEFQLYKKYQIAVHNDPPDKCTITSFTRFLITSPLKVQQERMSKTHTTFQRSWQLFKKYQMAIHNESVAECGEKQFCEFLVNTPLKTFRIRGTKSAVTYGTFHQQYWLDDKLIAVAVLDILPRCVSSVYFFYDPDYRFLTLGTYGSLREVQFVRSLRSFLPAIQYYYMGFYIHSCPKMRYKGKIDHSFLLCPETYNWIAIEKCVAKLDQNKYSRLNEDLDAIDENLCTKDDVDRIKVWVSASYSITFFGNYKHIHGEQDVFDNIGRLVGRSSAENLIFVSSKG